MNIWTLLSLDFIQLGLLAGLAISLSCPLVGVFLVHRRQSNFADTLSHSSLIGVVLSIWLGFSLQISIIGVCILTAVLIQLLGGRKNQLSDSVLVTVLSGSLAIAVMLNRFLPIKTIRLESFLFGDLSIISKSDVFLAFAVLFLTNIVFFLAYKKWFVMILGLDLAHISGIKTRKWDLVLAVTSAIVVAICIKIVGALLTSALIVIPVLIAANLTSSFKSSIWISLFISLFSVMSGLFGALIFDLPSGASIVLILLSLFIFAQILEKLNLKTKY